MSTRAISRSISCFVLLQTRALCELHSCIGSFFGHCINYSLASLSMLSRCLSSNHCVYLMHLSHANHYPMVTSLKFSCVQLHPSCPLAFLSSHCCLNACAKTTGLYGAVNADIENPSNRRIVEYRCYQVGTRGDYKLTARQWSYEQFQDDP